MSEYVSARLARLSRKIGARFGAQRAGDPRFIYGVAGVLAAPAGTFLGEHQYTLVSALEPRVVLIGEKGINRITEAYGMSFTGLMTSPIWRV